MVATPTLEAFVSTLVTQLMVEPSGAVLLVEVPDSIRVPMIERIIRNLIHWECAASVTHATSIAHSLSIVRGKGMGSVKEMVEVVLVE